MKKVCGVLKQQNIGNCVKALNALQKSGHKALQKSGYKAINFVHHIVELLKVENFTIKDGLILRDENHLLEIAIKVLKNMGEEATEALSKLINILKHSHPHFYRLLDQ